MIPAGSLEYALSRMQARLGQRPAEGAWLAIERARDIAPILDICRESSLQAVVKSLPAPCDLHTVDGAIRGGWRRAVEESMAWMPPEYCAALAWCRILPLLPALGALARGEQAALWMRSDPDLAEICASSMLERESVIAQGYLAPLAAAWKAPQALAAAWFDEWRRLVPSTSVEKDALADLVRDVGRHLRNFTGAEAHDAPQLRRDLQARLLGHFRRHCLEPAAAFAWLGLTALDLERLRGELARRLAFPRARLAT